MEKCQKPNIHLCNIILVIVETIFGSSEDFCLLYIYYLRKLVNIGKVKKKSSLFFSRRYTRPVCRNENKYCKKIHCRNENNRVASGCILCHAETGVNDSTTLHLSVK